MASLLEHGDEPLPDIAELLYIPQDSVADYVLQLIYRSTKVLIEKKKRLGGFDAALDSVEKVYLEELARAPDMAEGIAAFMEKREPKWT